LAPQGEKTKLRHVILPFSIQHQTFCRKRIIPFRLISAQATELFQNIHKLMQFFMQFF